jgi:hypothetical protein
MSSTNSYSSLSDYYRRTYYEWRGAYGLGDGCMQELVAAMRVELERPGLAAQEAQQLQKLIMTVEAELNIARTVATSNAA